MNRFEHIRNQVMKTKRYSYFTIHPIHSNPNPNLNINPNLNNSLTVDFDSNFSLFPLITLGNDSHGSTPTREESKEAKITDKLQIRPFLKEKRNRRWSRGEVSENVSSMMTRTYMPSVRINKKLEVQLRQSGKLVCGFQKPIQQLFSNRQAKVKKNSPSKSPKRMRRFSRIRRATSPKKLQSTPQPPRKFSISAWEINAEEHQF